MWSLTRRVFSVRVACPCGSKAQHNGEMSIVGDFPKKSKELFLPSKSKEIVILNHISLGYKIFFFNINHVVSAFWLVGLFP